MEVQAVQAGVLRDGRETAENRHSLHQNYCANPLKTEIILGNVNRAYQWSHCYAEPTDKQPLMELINAGKL